MRIDSNEQARGARGAGTARVLLIGMDIADGRLVERGTREGRLPALARLRERGAWGCPGTSASAMHVSAWPTIHTGTLPGKHGIYHSYQIRAGEQAIHRARAEECNHPPFWRYADAAGKRSVVVDPFFCPALDPFRGVQVLEYGTWTWFSEPAVRPRRLRRELLRRFGRYPVPEHTRVLTPPEPGAFRDALVAGAALKGRMARWLLEDEPWDLFYVTFAETHAAGHYLWPRADLDGPGDGAPAELLMNVYEAVDRAIGGLVEGLDESVAVIIVSGDGMGPNRAAPHLLPGVLGRLGLYRGAGAGEGQARKGGLLARARAAIPLAWREAVTLRMPRGLHYRLSMKWVNAGVDWERTKAFLVPNANEGYIRINLKGREPLGAVAGEGEYRELLARIGAAIEELVNPVNGVKAASVAAVDGLFPGERRADLPDLIVAWNPEAGLLSALASDRIGTVSGPPGCAVAPYYLGNHRPNAFVIGAGAGIRPGVMRGGHMVDLAPTILALLGVERPAHMDGEAWPEFLGGGERAHPED